jgi:hypothetical protein
MSTNDREILKAGVSIWQERIINEHWTVVVAGTFGERGSAYGAIVIELNSVGFENVVPERSTFAI